MTNDYMGELPATAAGVSAELNKSRAVIRELGIVIDGLEEDPHVEQAAVNNVRQEQRRWKVRVAELEVKLIELEAWGGAAPADSVQAVNIEKELQREPAIIKRLTNLRERIKAEFPSMYDTDVPNVVSKALDSHSNFLAALKQEQVLRHYGRGKVM